MRGPYKTQKQTSPFAKNLHHICISPPPPTIPVLKLLAWATDPSILGLRLARGSVGGVSLSATAHSAIRLVQHSEDDPDMRKPTRDTIYLQFSLVVGYPLLVVGITHE